MPEPAWIVVGLSLVSVGISVGVYLATVRRHSRELSVLWFKLDGIRKDLGKLSFAIGLLASSSNPHPNQDVIRICKEVAGNGSGEAA